MVFGCPISTTVPSISNKWGALQGCCGTSLSDTPLVSLVFAIIYIHCQPDTSAQTIKWHNDSWSIDPQLLEIASDGHAPHNQPVDAIRIFQRVLHSAPQVKSTASLPTPSFTSPIPLRYQLNILEGFWLCVLSEWSDLLPSCKQKRFEIETCIHIYIYIYQIGLVFKIFISQGAGHSFHRCNLTHWSLPCAAASVMRLDHI